MCFCESRRTTNDGTLTICLPTLNAYQYERVQHAFGCCSPNVTLADEDTSVVDGFGETELVDTGLETALQEILDLQGQYVIELHAGLVEHTDTDKTSNKGIAFEETLGVLLVEGKKLTI